MFTQKISRTSYDVIVSYSLTFIVVFLVTTFGYYFYFEWGITSAILWPASGTILALVWLRGYDEVIPILLALLVASYSVSGEASFPVLIALSLSQVLMAVFGVYFLRQLSFDDGFRNVRAVLVFLVVVICISMLIPAIATPVAYFFGDLLEHYYYFWIRISVASVFSILIIFPFFVSWSRRDVISIRHGRRTLLELVALFILLGVSTFAIFWLRSETDLFFLFLPLFFIAFFWACLRFSNRVVNLSVFSVTVFGMLGTFMVPVAYDTLDKHLTVIVLLFVIIVPIFYVFFALVQETNAALAELAENKNKVEKESLTKSEFIAVLAHELRNPLAPLQSTLEILELEDLPVDIKTLVMSAKNQVNTMRRLLEDLLDTTRMMQGKLKLQITRSNLCEMLHRCIDYTKSIYNEKRQTIVMKQTCDPTIFLDVDPIRFEQMIVNIFNNASKYTDEGGRVTVDYKVHNDVVSISITDTGIGIDSEHLDHVFDSFWQVDKAIKHSGDGIGVGLSLTKQIVEMHGGTIVAESPGLGKGSTFTINLPVSKPSKADIIPVPVPQITIQPISILVVDDNVVAADSLAKLLSLKKHTVKVAYSGKMALEAVKHTDTFKIILLDIGLADFDGYSVAKRLRALGYQGHLVALSGYSQKEDIEKAYRSGFDYYLTKPISIEALEIYFRNLA